MLGERVLTLESAAAERCTRRSHTGFTHILALLADGGAQRPDDERRRHQYRKLNQSLDTLSATLDEIAPRLGTDLRSADPDIGGPSTAATSHWASCSRALPMSAGSCPNAVSRSTGSFSTPTTCCRYWPRDDRR